MENDSKKFDEKCNQLILDLIKNKLSPLQKARKHKLLPQVFNHSKANSVQVKQTNLSFPSLPSVKLTHFNTEKENSEENLLDRVKYYLQNKRKQHHVPEEKCYLQPYIEFFQKPIENVGRLKRQSIELNFLQIQNHDRVIHSKQSLGFMQKEITLNEQECSLFNAKIRRKLNHKKLVDLNRRN